MLKEDFKEFIYKSYLECHELRGENNTKTQKLRDLCSQIGVMINGEDEQYE